MAKHFNGLTACEAERLALLAEECGEVIHCIGKILRHGLESYDPTEKNGPDNRERLSRELGDLYAAVELAGRAGVVDGEDIRTAEAQKLVTVRRWLHHGPKQGPTPGDA